MKRRTPPVFRTERRKLPPATRTAKWLKPAPIRRSGLAERTPPALSARNSPRRRLTGAPRAKSGSWDYNSPESPEDGKE
jgi:hypothetical protein